MNNVIDTRGLSCPQPVLATLDALTDTTLEAFTILVDTDTSKENVVRAVETLGWKVRDMQPDGGGFKIAIIKA